MTGSARHFRLWDSSNLYALEQDVKQLKPVKTSEFRVLCIKQTVMIVDHENRTCGVELPPIENCIWKDFVHQSIRNEPLEWQ